MSPFEEVAYIEYLLLNGLDPNELNGIKSLPDFLVKEGRDIQESFQRVPVPSLEQSCAVSPTGLYQVSALFYDRVWIPPTDYHFRDSGEVAFFTGGVAEIVVARGKSATDMCPFEDGRMHHGFRESLLRAVARNVQVTTGIEASCIYKTIQNQKIDYKIGSFEALTWLISDISVVKLDTLAWSHVHHMREDKDAILNLRRMRRWLDKEMAGKPLNAIQDEICLRIADYEEALRKHGLHTVTGTLSSLIDSKFLTAAGVATGALALAGGQALGIGGAIALGIGKAALELANRLIDYEDLKRKTNPEIAYVIELLKVSETDQ